MRQPERCQNAPARAIGVKMLRASTAINPPLTNPGNRACDCHWGMGDSAVGYTLGDAARATGLNKTAILKAIRSGKVSSVKDEHGQWRIEPCELHRVYPEQKALPLEARVVDLEADRNAKERFQMTERDFGMIAGAVGFASIYAWRGIWGAIATAGFIC